MKYANYHKRAQMKAAVAGVTARVPLKYWIIFIGLFLANIYVAVSSATYGSQLMSLEKEMKAITEQNKVLMEQMVTKQSFQNVALKAEDLRLVRPSEVVYLETPSSLTAAF